MQFRFRSPYDSVKMKLSCLFSVVMGFGVAAMMALPIDHGSFETHNTDHYHDNHPIHVQKNSPMDNTVNTWKSHEHGITSSHFKPDVYKSPKHFHHDRFGHKATVQEMADISNKIHEDLSITTNVPEKNRHAVDIPVTYYVEDVPDEVVENISIATNASETNLPYAIDIPLENYVNDISNDVLENSSTANNISEANLPRALDEPLEYDVEDDVSEEISIITNASETNIPYIIHIPLDYHVDPVFENISTNIDEPEATPPYLIDIPMEYPEHVELAEASEKENLSLTTMFSQSENATAAVVMIPDESMADNTEITVDCTDCGDIFETTTEPKLIGCMCALFTTQHPTENDIPLTSKTFHNVSCEQDVHSEDACNEVCIGVATVNNELMDHMVCSFVPSYMYNLKAFLQSKLCEEDAEWNFTGISSPQPICCYMGTQIIC